MPAAGSSDHWPADPLRDETGQRPFYESKRLVEIDVGLVWSGGIKLPPGFGSADFFEANRPPTRMHWWWSHGIPTLALRLTTLQDAARRAGYPESAVELRKPEQLETALRSIACTRVRECLRKAALRGAAVSSPQAAAATLVDSACRLLGKKTEPDINA